MNANELADELEKSLGLWFKDETAGKWIIHVLRKQAEELAEMHRLFNAAMDKWEKCK